MEKFFVKASSKDLKDFDPKATPYRIWSEDLKKTLRVYCNKGTLFTKFPDSEWYKIAVRQHYKCQGFETDIDFILPIKKDEEI